MSYKNHNRQNMNNALQQAGVNTNSYLSLRIDKRNLPDNAELVVMVRDSRTGQMIDVDLNAPNSPLGCKSRYYGQVMKDGHIFNPYIHRRFIAAQFRELVRTYGEYHLMDGVSKRFDWKYAIGLIQKECHTLALLEHHDRVGYDERSMFFTRKTICDILADYAQAVKQHADANAARACSAKIYIPGAGYVERSNLRPFKHRFDALVTKARECRSYAELDELLKSFDFVELSRDRILPRSFVNAYIAAGVYYTLKHAIMFEGKRLNGLSQRESLNYLLRATPNQIAGGCLSLYRQYA